LSVARWQEHIVELDEALALAALFCVGLLLLSCRFLLSERREVARRINAEQRARELAHQDALTGLPNRRKFDQELTAALAALPRTDGARALAFLAPHLVRAAVEGRLPRGIGVERLRDPPPEWSRQFEALGLNPE
jgi:hypothetical protein